MGVRTRLKYWPWIAEAIATEREEIVGFGWYEYTIYGYGSLAFLGLLIFRGLLLVDNFPHPGYKNSLLSFWKKKQKRVLKRCL